MRVTDVAVVGGGPSLLACVDELAASGVRTTACVANSFQEFALAACIFVADPTQHSAWVAQPSAIKKQGIDYVFDAVTKVDPDAKVITFAKSAQLQYKALVIATGSRLPLISPVPGATLDQRQEELAAAGRAISSSKRVVLNGSGTVGIELAGDILLRNPEVEVVLLTRSGTILNGDPFPLEQVLAVQDRLEEIGVKIVKGTAPASPEWLEYKLSPGTLPITGGDLTELSYDVYIPAFAQRPNTHFLDHTKALNERKRIIANQCLQSTVYQEIFGIGTTDQPLGGHPVATRLKAQAKTCAVNARRVAAGEAPVLHVDKEIPAPMPIPLNVKVGHSKDGWMSWSASVLPAPVHACCCIPCGGGFPFCPPLCCWFIPGCINLCGACGSSTAGSSEIVLSTILPIAAEQMGFGKLGSMPSAPKVAPPQQGAFEK